MGGPMGFFPFEAAGETLTNGERIRIIDDDETLCGLVRK
jgi:hypothetical protein